MYTAQVERPPVLVASSDDVLRAQILRNLQSAEWPVKSATGGADALLKLEEGGCEALVIDPPLKDLDVEEVISIAGERHPDLGVLVVDPATGQFRPARRSALTSFLLRALSTSPAHSLETESDAPTQPPSAETAFSEAFDEPSEELDEKCQPLPGMVGNSEQLRGVYKLVRLVARRESAVLITGETGTGKELVARAVHELSTRNGRPFVVVNCAAIPEPLLEAELFGYTRGAFTGAFQNRVGRIHSAHGGTLFLDEVGELPPGMQVKLLRFLQEGEVQRLGSSDVFRVDVRVVAATNADLLRRVSEGTFRQDLYYRLAVFPVAIPPLRERADDIQQLACDCIERLATSGYGLKRLSNSAAKLLRTHSWPGNVRELQHVIERAVILSEDSDWLLPDHFPTLQNVAAA